MKLSFRTTKIQKRDENRTIGTKTAKEGRKPKTQQGRKPNTQHHLESDHNREKKNENATGTKPNTQNPL